jgi:hypothetical protein
MQFIFVLILGATLTACAHTEKKVEAGEPAAVEEVFFADPELVDRAISQVMVKYPQKISNLEAGVLETDYIKGDARFQPPHRTITYGSGYRYRIFIHTVRGKTNGKSAIKVQVVKKVEQQRDFFADPEDLKSDFLEEKAILYRIGREIKIDKALTRFNQKSSGSVN